MTRDLLHEAYDAMRYNRRRTALTMLGMAWGIATVVMLLAYGDGFGRAIHNIFANFGTKLMIVVPDRTSMQAGGQKAGQQIPFTMEDVDVLTTNLPADHAHHSGGRQEGQHPVRHPQLQLPGHGQLSQRRIRSAP